MSATRPLDVPAVEAGYLSLRALSVYAGLSLLVRPERPSRGHHGSG